LLQAYHAPATDFSGGPADRKRTALLARTVVGCLSGRDESGVNDDLVEEFNRQYLWYPPLRAVDFNFSDLRRVLLKRSSREAEEFVDLLETKFPCPVRPPGAPS
jgi:hypothetical protein